jgi:hypothetical protein
MSNLENMASIRYTSREVIDMNEKYWVFVLCSALGCFVAGIILARALNRYLPPSDGDEHCLSCLQELSACKAELTLERRMRQELLAIIGDQRDTGPSFRIEGFRA